MDELTDDQRDDLARALHDLQERLTAELTGLDTRSGTVDLDQAAMGRVSRGDAMQQQQMALAERRRVEVRLLQITRALKALDDDEYGDCTRCGDPIGVRRLEARPETPFCVACATTLGT